ncbi:hypothetical protein [Aeromonas caviae]|jgi:hypothetical protein|uniref:hypothetical protein n=1 Tax=Aeromonas caviae TaxID=648 RepID=UPI0029D7D9CE|nr:hypothetical protein [Aeromonas caviae]MDX7786337.1 hypothetical protein [Aeromonas caviae]
MFSKMILAKAKQYSVSGVLFAGIWMGASFRSRAVLMAYDWPAFHAIMIEMLMFIQFISCVWLVLKCRAAIPAILLLIGVWQAPILIDVISDYRAAVDLFGAKFLLAVLLILPILIACWAKGGDAMPKEGDHVETA